MSHTQEFVSVEAFGVYPPPGTPEITLSFYGPRGGTRACQGIGLEAAKKLLSDLAAAVERLEGEKVPPYGSHGSTETNFDDPDFIAACNRALAK